jgi:hypothetical protein
MFRMPIAQTFCNLQPESSSLFLRIASILLIEAIFLRKNGMKNNQQGYHRLLTFHNSSLLAVSRLLLLFGRLLPTDRDMLLLIS